MSDERFDRDLAQVLRDVAGEEAPMSLRYRLANVTEQAPISRRLWFAPPMRLSMAVVAAVAVIVLAIMLVPRDTIGPISSLSPEPTPSVAPGEPTPTVVPTATPLPTPAPTVEQPSWTALEWSPGVVPFARNTSWISEIQPWDGGYLAVGGTFPSGQGTVFRSTDGQHWTVTYQADLPEGWSFEHLVPVGDGLLAVSDQRGVACEADQPCPPEGFDVAPRLWYSADGESWTQIDSPSWREVLGDTPPIEISGGAAGVVGVRANGTVVYSADGLNWQVADLPAAATAVPARAVTAFDGGFVVVGRDGSPDPFSQVVDTPLTPGSGRPAAWFSPNGVDWIQADVPGEVVPGGELREVAAGANGLFAAGIGEAVDTQTHPMTHGWASKDGITWTMVGRIGEDLPFFGGRHVGQGFLVSDGSNMVIFGQESATSPGVVAYSSTDGISWIPLAFSGAPSDFLTGVWAESGPQGMRYLTAATVVPGGVIASVYNGEVEFWFGVATAR